MIDDRPITDVKKRPLQGRRAKAALCGALGRKDIWTRSCEKEMVMAKVIGFYVPKNFRNRLNWAPQLHGGKVIEFRPQTKKSA